MENNQTQPLQVTELHEILAKQVRTLTNTDINDRNMPKIIAQSKEVGNLAGKIIALSHYDLLKHNAAASFKLDKFTPKLPPL